MASIGPRASGRTLWAWCVFGGILTAGFALGQGAKGLNSWLPALPDAADGRKLLDQFRQSMNAQPVYLEFELHALPRRGDERIYRGRLWGARDATGPITRISVSDADGGTRRFLVQGGSESALWRSEAGSRAVSDPAMLTEALVPGVETTAFDLQMPFLYWPDAKLESVVRIRGRATYAFLFRPPPDFAALHPEQTAVRAYLDTDYNALVQFELFGRDGRLTKTWSLLDLKKVEGKWIVKEVDVRNEITRNKTRFIVTGAALNISPDPSEFVPSRLAEDPEPPAHVVEMVP